MIFKDMVVPRIGTLGYPYECRTAVIKGFTGFYLTRISGPHTGIACAI